jgi:hypothetical protein
MDAETKPNVGTISRLCNEGRTVRFERDLGGFTLAVYLDDKHTHVGDWEGFDVMVENLYNALYGGPGLSWA